jgi:hypothetical protein
MTTLVQENTIKFWLPLFKKHNWIMITYGKNVKVTKTFEFFLVYGSYKRWHASTLEKVPWNQKLSTIN